MTDTESVHIGMCNCGKQFVRSSRSELSKAANRHQSQYPSHIVITKVDHLAQIQDWKQI